VGIGRAAPAPAAAPRAPAAADCAWLLLERARLARHGVRLADLPSLLASRLLTPRALLELLLAGLGLGAQERRAVYAAARALRVGPSHVLRVFAAAPAVDACFTYLVPSPPPCPPPHVPTRPPQPRAQDAAAGCARRCRAAAHPAACRCT
jgi:hypothetical protein